MLEQPEEMRRFLTDISTFLGIPTNDDASVD
jgi:hypothetical protein